MKSSSIGTVLAALVVVASGYGLGYLVLKGIEYAKPTTIVIETYSQKAASVETDQARGELESVPFSDQKVLKKAIERKGSNSNEITIMVGGDVMFDRGIRAIGERNGYDSLFDPSITSLFKKADIVAVNLEGPITSNHSKTLVDGKTTGDFTFTFSPDVAETLAHSGITLVGLANNHIDNFGFTGFTETQRWLLQSGISWFGNPWNSTSSKMSIVDINEKDSPIATVVHKKGFSIAFVGYHSFQFGIDRVIAEIKRISGPDVFTIVMPHWGEEYITTPSERMKSQARAFIDAGADAVIGAHPHVIMDQEWVGSVPVYYSVGNLLFDQYFSPGVMRGEIVELHFAQNASRPYLDHVETHVIKLKPGSGTMLE